MLQPDAMNGTDTFILSQPSLWNFGDNVSLWVGQDPANGTIGRSLLRLATDAVPPNATVLDATLELYAFQSSGGAIQAHRASAPWTEGAGQRSWTSVSVLVQETDGVPRTREPIEVPLTFLPGAIADPIGNLRVWSSGAEVPAQVSNVVRTGGQVISATVVFGATVPALGQRTFYVTYSVNGSAAPAYRAKTFAPTAKWTFPITGTGSSGVSVVDLDRDGELDVVFGTSNGYLYVLNHTLQEKWNVRLSNTNSIPFAPQIADVDRDGTLDIIVFVNTPEVVRLDPVTRNVVWRHGYTVGNLPLGTPTLLDVNDDGVLDVLIGGRTSQVDTLNGTDGTLLWSYLAADWSYTASVADVTGDGRGEVFFASDDRNVHAYYRDGTLLWAMNPGTSQFLENSVALGDLDGDGIREAVTVDDTPGGLVYAFDGLTGAVEWSTTSTTSGWREGGATLADLDGDGTLKVLVPVETGALAAFANTGGAPIWEYLDSAYQPLYPAVVDLDKDGFPEIVYGEEGRASGAAIRVLNHTGGLIYNWTIPQNDPNPRIASQFHMITPAIVDLDGDGVLEILAPTGAGLYAFETGGLAHDWRTWGYNWNHTLAALDGTSPDGASFLQVTLGAATVYPGAGASWEYRDGVVRWASVGGDFGVAEANATGGISWWSWNVTRMFEDWRTGVFPNVGLVLTEADEGSGGRHGFYSSDAADPALRPRLTITYVLPFSDPTPRIVGRIPDQRKAEDSPPWSLDLSSHAFDNDTPPQDLRWNITGFDPAKVQITGLNTPGAGIMRFYPQKDATGNMLVTYWLTDPDGRFATQQAWVNLTPINDPPTFNPPTPLVVRYNETYVFDFSPYIADIDTPLSSVTMTSDDPVRAAVSGFAVAFFYPTLPPDPWVFVTLTVSDGQASVSRVIAVKITEDFPPVLTRPLPDITMMEGEFLAGVFDLYEYFTDPNNDALFFSYGYSHLTITIHANHSVDILADTNWNGVERVTFRGTDPEGAIAEDTILVTVMPVNDPPSLGPVPDLRVHWDEAYLFNLDPYISDPDTPIDQINASTSSPFVTVSGHLLTLIYPSALNGTVQVLTIWIGDGTTVVSRTINVTVGSDFPPYLSEKLLDRAFDEDGRLDYAYLLARAFFDPDDASLYYSSGNTNVLVSIDASGVVNLSAAPDWNGRERVTFRAVDSQGAFAEDSVWITVNPVNDAPTIAAIPVLYVNVTTTFFDLSPYLDDVDNNLTDLLVTTSDPRAQVIGQGLLLRFASDGTEAIQIAVSDGDKTTAGTITVIVELPSPPPARIPGWLYWLPFPLGFATLAAFLVYRRRKIEWAFLVTSPGLLVCSMSRREPTPLDTDLMTGMLTTIMDFANKSFSDEKQRNIEGLDLGDRQLAIVRGDVSYLAVVYSGRTPGSLIRIMRSLLEFIEKHHRDALGDIVDTSKLGDIPDLLQKLVKYGWWPFVTFSEPREPKGIPQ